MNRPRSLRSILQGTTENWLADQASSISAALAFYCAFSLAPLLIIIVTIAGWIVGDQLAYSYLDSSGDDAVRTPECDADPAGHGQRAFGRRSTWATIVSVVMLIVGASTVFAALESALQQIWGGRTAVPRNWRSFVRARLISLRIHPRDRLPAAGVAAR
mgnify:CR=1 FL=1